MRTPTSGTPDRAGRTLGGLRGAALGAVLLLLSGCSSSPGEISADTIPPAATVTPDACRLLPADAVAAALALPSGAEVPASSATPSPQPSGTPDPAPRGRYLVTSVGSHSTVGQCTYQSWRGPALVVSVFPKSTLTTLADVTAGLRPLGPAYAGTSGTSGLIAVQDGPAVVGIALNVGGLSGDPLVRRLALLAGAVSGQPLPVPSLSASQGATSAAVPTPLPAAGEQVTGQAAAQTVQETAGLKFDPAAITVSSGGVVQWTNAGTAPHNVTFDANPELTSGTMGGGDKYQVKFTRAGQYPYHCTFHPGMDGTVTVS
ncbi:MAG TPA: plastocyanin/azurin family copper-binding protein [Candidatus Dormibacteraeota bacterium]|jgi:plastocyanin|nr:plastocyanin/azurin family copper-binding protein [Candidatus Dormibacteraeota bacterium]